MIFLIGVLIGILVMQMVLFATMFLRTPLEKTLSHIENKIREVSPREKGFIVEPDSDEEIARREIIEENQRHGRDTKFEELL